MLLCSWFTLRFAPLFEVFPSEIPVFYLPIYGLCQLLQPHQIRSHQWWLHCHSFILFILDYLPLLSGYFHVGIAFHILTLNYFRICKSEGSVCIPFAVPHQKSPCCSTSTNFRPRFSFVLYAKTFHLNFRMCPTSVSCLFMSANGVLLIWKLWVTKRISYKARSIDSSVHTFYFNSSIGNNCSRYIQKCTTLSLCLSLWLRRICVVTSCTIPFFFNQFWNEFSTYSSLPSDVTHFAVFR